jgi:hypothetical protein
MYIFQCPYVHGLSLAKIQLSGQNEPSPFLDITRCLVDKAVMDDPLTLLNARLIEITRQKERIAVELESLAREERELKMAESVMKRLTRRAFQETAVARALHVELPSVKIDRVLKTSGIPAKGTPRPNGLPTVPEMATALLQEAEQRGISGLTGRQIMDGIAARWWPGVGWSSVLPTILRGIREGRGPFEKDGDKIRLKKSEGSNALRLFEPSKSTGVA